MNKPIRIIGHGLAGCVLAMTLYKRGIPFEIVGSSSPGEASLASSGLINPITGRRYVLAWMADELLYHAISFYQWTEELLQDRWFFPVEIVRFLKNEEAHKAWHKRLSDPEYTRFISNKTYPEVDYLGRPYGIVTGAWRLDTPGWIHSVRDFLRQKGHLITTANAVGPEDAEDYRLIHATGAIDHRHLRWIIPNRGEALIVRMPEWQIPVIVKDEIFIIPLGHDHLYWVGSYYEPEESGRMPTEEGKVRLIEAIRKLYHGPIAIEEHLTGVRPTVDDRRPLVGPIPEQPGQFMFNGMGTKGTSLAPYWADALVSHILTGASLPAEVLPGRPLLRPS